MAQLIKNVDLTKPHPTDLGWIAGAFLALVVLLTLLALATQASGWVQGQVGKATGSPAAAGASTTSYGRVM